jgi:hypothetical protein
VFREIVLFALEQVVVPVERDGGLIKFGGCGTEIDRADVAASAGMAKLTPAKNGVIMPPLMTFAAITPTSWLELCRRGLDPVGSCRRAADPDRARAGGAPQRTRHAMPGAAATFHKSLDPNALPTSRPRPGVVALHHVARPRHTSPARVQHRNFTSGCPPADTRPPETRRPSERRTAPSTAGPPSSSAKRLRTT